MFTSHAATGSQNQKRRGRRGQRAQRRSLMVIRLPPDRRRQLAAWRSQAGWKARDRKSERHSSCCRRSDLRSRAFHPAPAARPIATALLCDLCSLRSRRVLFVTSDSRSVELDFGVAPARVTISDLRKRLRSTESGRVISSSTGMGNRQVQFSSLGTPSLGASSLGVPSSEASSSTDAGVLMRSRQPKMSCIGNITKSELALASIDSKASRRVSEYRSPGFRSRVRSAGSSSTSARPSSSVASHHSAMVSVSCVPVVATPVRG